MTNCKRCGERVWTKDLEGFDDDYCGRCIQAFIDRANESREWSHFHPGEPTPASELTPLPERSHQRSKAPVGECSSCDREREAGNDFHPPHDASKNCESGGKNHCSCDVCF